MTPKRLKDRVAIVTGGAQGIGRAYCLNMALEGAKIVVADVNLEAVKKTATEIQKKAGKPWPSRQTCQMSPALRLWQGKRWSALAGLTS